jgi:hypothetical protein
MRQDSRDNTKFNELKRKADKADRKVRDWYIWSYQVCGFIKYKDLEKVIDKYKF